MRQGCTSSQVMTPSERAYPPPLTSQSARTSRPVRSPRPEDGEQVIACVDRTGCTVARVAHSPHPTRLAAGHLSSSNRRLPRTRPEQGESPRIQEGTAEGSVAGGAAGLDGNGRPGAGGCYAGCSGAANHRLGQSMCAANIEKRRYGYATPVSPREGNNGSRAFPSDRPSCRGRYRGSLSVASHTIEPGFM